MSKYGCERCGDVTLEVTMGPVTIADAITVRLCLPCREDWRTFFDVTPLRRDLAANDVRAQMALAQTQTDGIDRTDVVMGLWDEGQALRTQVHQAAREWIAGGK